MLGRLTRQQPLPGCFAHLNPVFSPVTDIWDRQPSGQAVHDYMENILGRKLREPQLQLLTRPMFAGLQPGVLREATPLWFYILAEGGLNQGRRLGPVGGRIVAEVLFGLLECDRTSFLGMDRSWSPFLGGRPGRFRIPDLLKIAYEEAPEDDDDEGDDDEA